MWPSRAKSKLRLRTGHGGTDGRRHAMTPEATIETAAAAGAIVRAGRAARGLSQQTLSAMAGVSRKFFIDLEAGHDRAALGKTLAAMSPIALAPGRGAMRCGH